MDRDGIVQLLTPLFRDIFESDDLVLSDSLSAKDVPEWDSLSNVRLFVAIEQAFRVRFTSAEITGLQNVGQLIGRLIQKCAA